jgi:hypothetical protein
MKEIDVTKYFKPDPNYVPKLEELAIFDNNPTIDTVVKARNDGRILFVELTAENNEKIMSLISILENDRMNKDSLRYMVVSEIAYDKDKLYEQLLHVYEHTKVTLE